MKRWFFADEEERCKRPIFTPVVVQKEVADAAVGTLEDDWHFSVIMPYPLKGNERMAISGDCETLGNWMLSDTAIMDLNPETNRYTLDVKIPRDRDVEYRYLIIAIENNPLYGTPCRRTIARKWETHLEPRCVRHCQNKLVIEEDVFGTKQNEENLDHGWLTTETYVQFKFFNRPLLEHRTMTPRPMNVKVTPKYAYIRDRTCEPLEKSSSSLVSIDCFCGDFPSLTYAFNEVGNMSNPDDSLKPQPEWGARCGPEDLTLFHLTLGDFEHTTYLFDIYTYQRKSCSDEPPCHYAYGYLMHSQLKYTEGRVDIPLICASKFRPLGRLSIEYMIIKPTYGLEFDISRTYAHHWNERRNGMGVGHRGCGVSYRLHGGIMRENTIYSLWQAGEHGAEMIELDVMLTKDEVPIVYHDFMLNVALKPIENFDDVLNEHDVFAFPMTDFNLNQLLEIGTRINKCFLAVPVSKFTLEQLSKLRVLRYAVDQSVAPSCWSLERLRMQHPFPPLQEVLERIQPKVAINIEIKWSQRENTGAYEERFKPDMDRNEYLDAILQVLFRKAGNRVIFLSCFDVDCCAMLRFKQNYFPVILVFDNDFIDVRIKDFSTAVTTAKIMRLLGVAARDSIVFENPQLVKLVQALGLILLTWGPLSHWLENRKILINYGVNAVIFDRIDQMDNVGIPMKRNVFVLETAANQREIREIIDTEMVKRNISIEW